MTTATIDHDVAVAQSSELLDRKRLSAARDVLSNALTQYPDSEALLTNAALLDWLDDRLAEAQETIHKVLEIAPDSYTPRYLLAKIYLELENFIESEQAFIDLLRDYPEEPELYAMYASIMLQTFNIEKAQKLAAEALRRDPSNENAMNVHVLCGFIGSSGEEQRRRLHELLTEHPDQAQTTIRVVQMLLDQGKNKEAYALARELVVLDPSNEELVELAASLRRMSHWSLLPLWPMQKWGWAGSVGIWLIAIGIINSGLLDDPPLDAYKGPFTMAILIYVVYSWVWPPILKRILR